MIITIELEGLRVVTKMWYWIGKKREIETNGDSKSNKN